MANPPLYNNLKGLPQVEPDSSAWWAMTNLRTVVARDIVASVGFPHYVTDHAKAFAELDAKFLQPAARSADPVVNPPVDIPNLSKLLSHPEFLSRPPAGAQLGDRVGTAAEVATLFEAETPGLWHRHVLNVIFDPEVPGGAGQTVSPPRQGLIWAALDIAISSALQAAWFYKWVGTASLGRTPVEYRQRPAEFKPAYPFLYDLQTELVRVGGLLRVRRHEPKAKPPAPNPGTPRHPAYPSGHSTYSAAASRVLGCLLARYEDPRFPRLDWQGEFDRLASNIGHARLYGGVHWIEDDEFGQKLGRAVGDAVIAQLNASGIETNPAKVSARSPDEALLRFARFASNPLQEFCKNGGIPQAVPIDEPLQNIQKAPLAQPSMG